MEKLWKNSGHAVSRQPRIDEPAKPVEPMKLMMNLITLKGEVGQLGKNLRQNLSEKFSGRIFVTYATFVISFYVFSNIIIVK